jgi:hypothetical protein
MSWAAARSCSSRTTWSFQGELWTATEQFRANGPEFVSAVLKSWAAEQQIELDFTTPGRPGAP